MCKARDVVFEIYGIAFLMKFEAYIFKALNFKDTPSILDINFGVSYRLDRHRDPIKKNDNISAKSKRKRMNRSRKKSKKKKVKNFD